MNLTWESSVSYKDFIIGSYNYFKTNKAPNIIDELKACSKNIYLFDLLIVILLAIFQDRLRYYLSKIFTKFAFRRKMEMKKIKKFNESAWKCLFHTSMLLFYSYILFWKECGRFILSPSSSFDESSENISSIPPNSYYIIYMINLSHYFQALHAVFFLDTWRKDTGVLIVHHFDSIALLSLSWLDRIHQLGLVVLFLHDLCDPILEFSKCANYLKTQSNEIITFWERTTDISFCTFAFVWFVTRIYIFPLRAIYYTCIYYTENPTEHPMLFYIISLLHLLLTMNIYWTITILQVLMKKFRGQPLEDIREEENSTKKLN